MKTTFVALLVATLLGIAGRANADEKVWALNSPTRAADCAYCHGLQGEGGMGPDLAGRGITLEQFKTAVRKPWGMMPAYPNLKDETLLDLYTYLQGLPKVAQPAAWRVPVPGDSVPKGQRTLVVYGCAQCHGTEMVRPRVTLGGMGTDANFAAFSKIVYQHIELYERNFMGLFSKDRLPESSLKEIFDFMQAIGFRAPLTGTVTAVSPAGGNTTYTLTVANAGKAGKGLTAEDITLSLIVPEGSTVVSTTGAGYQGVQKDAKRNANVAVWKLPSLAADARAIYTLTLSGAANAAGLTKGSSLAWAKPEFHALPGQIQDPMDEKRIPAEKGDAANITVKLAPASQ